MMNDEEASASSSQERGLDRILALSDGIFAFAITLLVLGLTVPNISESGLSQIALNSKLLESLGAETTAFYSYGISFAVIAIWWVAHHRIFQYIKRYDQALMWRNLLFLLFVTIIPFLTQLMNDYGNVGIAVIIYDASQFVGGFALAGIWKHASSKHLLISRSLSEGQIKGMQFRIYIPSMIFLIALVVAALFSFSYQTIGIPPGCANFALFGIAPMMRLASKSGKSVMY